MSNGGNSFLSYGRSRRHDRAPPPPRFARRGAFSERSRGNFERGGRGRGRSRGGNSSAPYNAKKPTLTKQNSSDFANEEWETASESSDVLEKNREAKNDPKDKDKKENVPVKKSFSSQRPVNDRQNRRGNSTDTRKSQSMERGKNVVKEKSPNATKNGSAPTRSGGSSNTKNKTINANRKENIAAVYRVDSIVPNDQTAINNAFNSLTSK